MPKNSRFWAKQTAVLLNPKCATVNNVSKQKPTLANKYQNLRLCLARRGQQ